MNELKVVTRDLNKKGILGTLQGSSQTNGVLATALAHGLTIFVLIAAMGHIR